MSRILAGIPFLFGSVLAEVLTENTGIALGLAVACFITSGALMWRARGEKEKIMTRITDLEREIEELKKESEV